MSLKHSEPEDGVALCMVRTGISRLPGGPTSQVRRLMRSARKGGCRWSGILPMRSSSSVVMTRKQGPAKKGKCYRDAMRPTIALATNVGTSTHKS